MSTQPTLLAFSAFTVDAISWSTITLSYAFRPDMEAEIINAGDVSVELRVSPTDSAHAFTLISGDSRTFKPGTFPRGQEFPPRIVCYAKAASGTTTVRVIER